MVHKRNFPPKLEFFHDKNVTGLLHEHCGDVMTLPFQDRCKFISNIAECHESSQYFNYLNFIFCDVGSRSKNSYLLGVFLICVLSLYLFAFLATTADKFFCPALAVISKILKMSENVAGVTLLAFGNGSPDVFSSLAHYKGDTELMYTELIGAAAFVTGFIAGLVMIIKPFKIVAENYIQDVLFFLVAAFLMDFCIHNQMYSLYEGIATVMVYVAYLTCVILKHVLMKRKIHKIKQLSSTDLRDLTKLENLEDIAEIKIYSRKDSSVIFDNEIISVFRKEFHDSANKNLLKTFIQGLNPIDIDDWQNSHFLGKVLIILKIPVTFFLLLFIPIVDYGETNLHGWSKLLDMLHIITLPQLVLFVTGSIETSFYLFFVNVPLAAFVFAVSIIISCVVYFTSRNDCPPKYHAIFATGSFVGCICVIYTVAKEVVSVMKAVGIISDMTDSMIGLSILAWGNSIGDLFSNIALARQGYQQMAFSACFGGPLFNSLLGVGLTIIMKALDSKDLFAFAREGAMGPNCIIFLNLILSFTFFALLFSNFCARKSIGIYMILIYCIFMLYSVLGEFEIMHPYGTDHERT